MNKNLEIRVAQKPMKDFGNLWMAAHDRALVALSFNALSLKKSLSQWQADREIVEKPSPLFKQLINELQKYFRGQEVSFQIPFDLGVLPPFIQKTLKATFHLPWGTVISYGDLASSVGHPGAARAVGQAMNRNPLPIVIPCHRVVAANGLGGFATSLSHKKFLLGLEGLKW